MNKFKTMTPHQREEIASEPPSPKGTRLTNDRKALYGTTLPNGEVISKDDRLIACTGTLSELSAFIGRIKASYFSPESTVEIGLKIAASEKLFFIARLTKIQEELEEIRQSMLTTRKHSYRFERTRFDKEKITELEQEIDRMGIDMEKVKSVSFISGTTAIEADFFLARAITHRLERQLIGARNLQIGTVPDDSIFRYANRLADYFLCSALYVCKIQNQSLLQIVRK